jgi:hypothetical protein
MHIDNEKSDSISISSTSKSPIPNKQHALNTTTELPATIIHTIGGERKLRIEEMRRGEYTLLSYHLRPNNSSSSRTQWELLATVEPSVFPWTYQDPQLLQQRDELRSAGNTAINDASRNLDIRFTGAATRFCSTLLKGVAEGEVAFRVMAGRLIADLLSSDILPAYW